MKTKYGTLLKSDGALSAEEEGRYPLLKAIKVLKQLRPDLTREQSRGLLLLCSSGEWHHVGKFANQVQYYDPDDVIERLASDPDLLSKIKKSPEKPTESTVNAEISWTVYVKERWAVKKLSFAYKGPATIKGDWISFVHLGQPVRKRLSGRNCCVRVLD